MAKSIQFKKFAITIWQPCVQAKKEVKLSVYLMIFGAAVAASNDLAFDLMGYVYIMMNNLMTSASGVYTKKKLDAKSLGWFCQLHYLVKLIHLKIV